MNEKIFHRRKRKKNRIRKKISGTKAKPRLTIFKSNAALYAQAVDDKKGCTLASALVKSKNRKAAMELGKLFSDKASEAKIKKMVFDRNGYRYHGIVKTFADTVRENNIQI